MEFFEQLGKSKRGADFLIKHLKEHFVEYNPL
jgi:hypothetical protein